MRSARPDTLQGSCTGRRRVVGATEIPDVQSFRAVVHSMHTPDDDVLIPFFITERSIPRSP